jgi:Cu(I)/Ag(I) efflux system membrane fusion protein
MRTLLILLITTFFLIACGKDDPSESLSDAKDDTPLEHARKHLEAKYVCPMHPHIVRPEQGNCPICGMNLVKKEIKPEPTESLAKAKEDTPLDHARKHLEAKYVCPMLTHIVRPEAGYCPICVMNFVKIKIEPKKRHKTYHA